MQFLQDLEALVGVWKSADAQGCTGWDLKADEFLKKGRAWLGVLSATAKLRKVSEGTCKV